MVIAASHVAHPPPPDARTSPVADHPLTPLSGAHCSPPDADPPPGAHCSPPDADPPSGAHCSPPDADPPPGAHSSSIVQLTPDTHHPLPGVPCADPGKQTISVSYPVYKLINRF